MVGVVLVPLHLSLNNQLGERSTGVECNGIITATDVLPVDEDIWNCPLSCYLLQNVLNLCSVLCTREREEGVGGGRRGEGSGRKREEVYVMRILQLAILSGHRDPILPSSTLLTHGKNCISQTMLRVQEESNILD